MGQGLKRYLADLQATFICSFVGASGLFKRLLLWCYKATNQKNMKSITEFCLSNSGFSKFNDAEPIKSAVSCGLLMAILSNRMLSFCQLNVHIRQEIC